MKIIDPERWIFTLTALAIAVVFIFLTPSTQIIAHWFPGKTDRLWFYPGFLFALSFILWLAYRWSLPSLIAKGVFEDRRKKRVLPKRSPSERTWHWLRPMLRLLTHVFLVAALCAAVLSFMRSRQNQELLETIAQQPNFEARVRNHKW